MIADPQWITAVGVVVIAVMEAVMVVVVLAGVGERRRIGRMRVVADRIAEAPQYVGHTPTESEKEILVRKNPSSPWSILGHRHALHPDIQEAIDTPNLAIRNPDGSVILGNQVV